MSIIKQKTLMLLVVCLVGVVIFNGNYSARGATTHTNFPVTQDAYVYSYDPDVCYGRVGDLIIGNYSGNWTETYILFNLTGRPAQWSSVDLWFSAALFPANTSGYLQETSTSWSEDTITWNNRPALEAYKENMTIERPMKMWINLTTLIHRYDASPSSTIISLLLNSTPVADGNFSAFNSKDYATSLGPNLRWYYEQAEPFDPAPVIIAAACIGAGIVMVTIVVKRRGKKKPATKAAKPDPFEDLKLGK